MLYAKSIFLLYLPTPLFYFKLVSKEIIRNQNVKNINKFLKIKSMGQTADQRHSRKKHCVSEELKSRGGESEMTEDNETATSKSSNNRSSCKTLGEEEENEEENEENSLDNSNEEMDDDGFEPEEDDEEEGEDEFEDEESVPDEEEDEEGREDS